MNVSTAGFNHTSETYGSSIAAELVLPSWEVRPALRQKAVGEPVIGTTTPGSRAMARRSRDWNEGLAQDLRDQEFAREFLLAAMDEGVPIQVALGKVIRAMGVKEFAAKVKMAGPNVLRAINPRHNPTQDTMNRLLKPFRLKLSLARIDEPRGRRAA
jgi:DNA-binding phage protein